MTRERASGVDMRRIAPALLAGVLAAAYVIIAPGSGDLAAHLLRAKLFSAEGFGLWNNWWYAGHPVLLYSVLFPPVAAVLTPQLAAAIAATATAAFVVGLGKGGLAMMGMLGVPIMSLVMSPIRAAAILLPVYVFSDAVAV